MRAYIVLGLTYGDEGKGSIVDSLARTVGAGLVVRFNGGAQAAHTVVAPDGRKHTFRQFGSGTLAGAHTLLSRFHFFNPTALVHEANQLKELGVRDPYSCITVDGDAPITTPYHVIANRVKEEARGKHRHGSCGMGIGETAQDLVECSGDVLRAQHLKDPGSLRRYLELHRERKHREVAPLLHLCSEGTQISARQVFCSAESEATIALYRELSGFFRISPEAWQDLRSNLGAHPVILEGAQGILLDEDHGAAPWHTWSKTTSKNARTLLREAAHTDFEIFGVTRIYATRHGLGPLPTESAELTELLNEPDNKENAYQGPFRVGYWDPEALATALSYEEEDDGLVDGVCLTHVDRVPIVGYPCTDSLPRIVCESRGPSASDKTWDLGRVTSTGLSRRAVSR